MRQVARQSIRYGRTFDKQTNTWGVDPQKKRLIERAAREYLNGGSFLSVANKLGMGHSKLLKTLKERSGNTWEILSKLIGHDV